MATEVWNTVGGRTCGKIRTVEVWGDGSFMVHPRDVKGELPFEGDVTKTGGRVMLVEALALVNKVRLLDGFDKETLASRLFGWIPEIAVRPFLLEFAASFRGDDVSAPDDALPPLVARHIGVRVMA